jgi:MerR family mercuric resistance operon transcriptional regulator
MLIGGDEMETLTIGQLAKKADVHIETIRYYERKGLIPEPRRRESGYREYSDETANRILFIKRAKDLGFSLMEVDELLSLKISPGTTCSDVKSKAEEKIADIEGKIKTLQRMKKALVKVTKTCSGAGPASECPILEALEK